MPSRAKLQLSTTRSKSLDAFAAPRQYFNTRATTLANAMICDFSRRLAHAWISATLCILLTTTVHAAGRRCTGEGQLRSVEAATTTQITFANNTPDPIRIYWLDYQGARRLYAQIQPSSTVVQPTFVTHAWITTNTEDDCLWVYLADSAPRRVEINSPPNPADSPFVFQQPYDLTSIAISRDGRSLLAAGANGVAYMLDARTGTQLASFPHGSNVVSAAYSPAGDVVATAGDQTLVLWDARSLQRLRTFQGHSDFVTSVAFSPDTKQLLSASADKTIKLWDVATGALLRTFVGHSDSITSASFFPDGSLIVSASADRTLRTWDARTGALLTMFAGHSARITSAAFSPDGLRLVSGSDDRTLRLWDLQTGRNLTTLVGHADRVTTVALSSNSILSGSTDGTVRLWNAGGLLRTFETAGSVVSVGFSRDGDKLVAASANGAIQLWRDQQFDVVPVMFGTDRKPDPEVKRLTFSRERGKSLLLGRALVSVPKDHMSPQLERPRQLTVFKYKIALAAEDPNKHFTIQDIGLLTPDLFGEALRRQLTNSQYFKDHALVFLHGYNVAFDAALYRTAQIAYDLQFDGVPFLYSWPSGGGLGSYLYDRESAKQAEPFLQEFLELLMRESKARKISIIAHSLGNQLLLEVLKEIRAHKPQLKVSQVILAAPDIDRDVFQTIAGRIRGIGDRITLYASANDIAMKASGALAQGPRAGDVPPVIIAGIDAIDVTSIGTDFLGLNHSRYAENVALLNDIKLILMKGDPSELRAPILRKIPAAGGAYWRW